MMMIPGVYVRETETIEVLWDNGQEEIPPAPSSWLELSDEASEIREEIWRIDIGRNYNRNKIKELRRYLFETIKNIITKRMRENECIKNFNIDRISEFKKHHIRVDYKLNVGHGHSIADWVNIRYSSQNYGLR